MRWMGRSRSKTARSRSRSTGYSCSTSFIFIFLWLFLLRLLLVGLRVVVVLSTRDGSFLLLFTIPAIFWRLSLIIHCLPLISLRAAQEPTDFKVQTHKALRQDFLGR